MYELATHPYGCRVLQRCFEHLQEDHIRPLMDELHKHVTQLMQDQFGVRILLLLSDAQTLADVGSQNYVVQFVLEHGKSHDRTVVVSKLRGQMIHMARHKFASNVCEKALVTADPENRRLLIEELMAPRQDGLSPVLAMMKDQYASTCCAELFACCADCCTLVLQTMCFSGLSPLSRASKSKP